MKDSLVTTVPTDFFEAIDSLKVPNKPENMKVHRTSTGWVIYAYHGPSWIWTDEGWTVTLNKPHSVGKRFATALEAFEVAKTLHSVKSTLPSYG